jgi:Luciferase-like monooxygenase
VRLSIPRGRNFMHADFAAIRREGDFMDLSLFFEIETADSSEAGVKRYYDECIEQVMLADELGYLTAWFVEHHFTPFLSYCTAPEMVLAHLAGRTRNIRLGHGIVPLPFNINHPVRVAERIAVLDLLSNGRRNSGAVARLRTRNSAASASIPKLLLRPPGTTWQTESGPRN